MKKILFIAIAAMALICGCRSENTSTSCYSGGSTNVSTFNNETYVWESFNFTTNKVEGF